MKKSMCVVMMLLIMSMMFGATVGTLALTGTVNNVIAITVTEMNLPLDLTASTTVQVALVTESSNKNGYSVELTSLNSGKLIGGVTAEELTYTATYGGNAVTLSSTVQEITTNGSKTSSTDKAFVISYTIVEYALSPDTYTDTLTFTIIAN